MNHRAEAEIDVLMCVGAGDIHHLMAYSLKSCIANFELLNEVTIVTSDQEDVISVLDQHGLNATEVSVRVLHDNDILPPPLRDLPGWCKQQYIRLHADQVCGTPFVACLSADTLMCKPVGSAHLFSGGDAVLYYNRYPHPANHLAYERRRVENVARILDVTPAWSWPLGDFIMDFMLFDGRRLKELRRHLFSLYGDEAFRKILPGRCDTIEQRVSFGEWTLYAVFLLDVLKAHPPVRNSENRFIAQVHSVREFDEFHFDAHVVHFVDKSFDLDRILTALDKSNRCR